jgi:hypothetical protein
MKDVILRIYIDYTGAAGGGPAVIRGISKTLPGVI